MTGHLTGGYKKAQKRKTIRAGVLMCWTRNLVPAGPDVYSPRPN